ncbi:nucleotidyltransferase [Candidatus Woesearchaeota archaeon CG10_big_fil_rev_8_21_14_0_10_34_12]|nr:MAG: nucleotidyltransferase [Candidatus Woesearchaeota archaeon CG10_big_fil_rev_8_21_14_0_10_34_12]
MNSQTNKFIERIGKDERVIAVALFGSSLKGIGRDIDVCVFLGKDYSNLEMSRIKLDFLKNAGKNIDVQIFQQLPVYIKVRVLKEGKILFCNNEDELYEIAFSTIKEFGFFKKAYEMYLNEVENGQKKSIV